MTFNPTTTLSSAPRKGKRGARMGVLPSTPVRAFYARISAGDSDALFDPSAAGIAENRTDFSFIFRTNLSPIYSFGISKAARYLKYLPRFFLCLCSAFACAVPFKFRCLTMIGT